MLPWDSHLLVFIWLLSMPSIVYWKADDAGIYGKGKVQLSFSFFFFFCLSVRVRVNWWHLSIKECRNIWAFFECKQKVLYRAFMCPLVKSLGRTADCFSCVHFGWHGKLRLSIISFFLLTNQDLWCHIWDLKRRKIWFK